ncbi:hypothetical protein CPLU01_09687 [Colletotrichum plurivorum]|uniref:Uncharacterized protein n=1 Tax=Colletotrichum plurivorum TaxID=2175906 RepID=A0A8H6K7U3_9PEZI|nr:hypothetical protein CPLU01_09687 [Colletotrichum plurivorum]
MTSAGRYPHQLQSQWAPNTADMLCGACTPGNGMLLGVGTEGVDTRGSLLQLRFVHLSRRRDARFWSKLVVIGNQSTEMYRVRWYVDSRAVRSRCGEASEGAPRSVMRSFSETTEGTAKVLTAVEKVENKNRIFGAGTGWQTHMDGAAEDAETRQAKGREGAVQCPPRRSSPGRGVTECTVHAHARLDERVPTEIKAVSEGWVTPGQAMFDGDAQLTLAAIRNGPLTCKAPDELIGQRGLQRLHVAATRLVNAVGNSLRDVDREVGGVEEGASAQETRRRAGGGLSYCGVRYSGTYLPGRTSVQIDRLCAPFPLAMLGAIVKCWGRVRVAVKMPVSAKAAALLSEEPRRAYRGTPSMLMEDQTSLAPALWRSAGDQERRGQLGAHG